MLSMHYNLYRTPNLHSVLTKCNALLDNSNSKGDTKTSIVTLQDSPLLLYVVSEPRSYFGVRE